MRFGRLRMHLEVSGFAEFEATSHSTIFDIPMRPLHEDQKHRHRFTR